MRAIGIDLGTTNSAAAVGGGEPRVLPTRDGEQLTPSVVSYVRRRSGDGEIVVGRQAANNAVRDPGNTIFSIKRLMGRQYGEEQVDEVQRRFGVHLAEVPSDQEADQGVRVMLNDRPYSPVEISSLILRQIKEDAEQALGEAVTHAVITVPAWFEERQRQATTEAGRQAGLEVLRVLDEPTAAALAFGVGREEERHRVLVYDLGGGTFDISIIQMTGGDYVQLEIRGDNWLGGDDFDRKIVERMLAWVRQEHGEDLAADRIFRIKAKEHAQRAKIGLSTQKAVDIFAPLITTVEGVGGIDIEMELTREEFEADIRPDVERTIELVHEALQSQSLTPEDITQVLMVGGSTAVPMVQEAVAEVFGRDKVRRHVNPMECVALGAGILAAGERLDVDDQDAEVVGTGPRVDQITPMDLGIEAVEGERRDVFVPVIPRGTPYPLHQPKSRVFYPTEDNQNLIRIPVYEGLNQRASLNEQQGVIEFPLPVGIPGNTPVEVSFNYDKSRTLTVSVRIRARDSEGKETRFEQTLQRNRPRARAGQTQTLVDDWREGLQPSIMAGKHFLENYSAYMEADDREELEKGIRDGEQALTEDNKTKGEQASRVLQHKLMGSGTASMLFIAERVMAAAPNRELAQLLSQATAALRTAHKNNNRDDVNRLSSDLRLTVAQIISRREAVQSVDDRQDWHQLLRLRK